MPSGGRHPYRALLSEGKGRTFESGRVRQFFFILQSDMRDPTKLQRLRIRASQQFDEKFDAEYR
jgi:hypothetical protein